MDRDRQRQIDRETETEIGTETETETETRTYTDGQTDRQRDRQTDTDRKAFSKYLLTLCKHPQAGIHIVVHGFQQAAALHLVRRSGKQHHL